MYQEQGDLHLHDAKILAFEPTPSDSTNASAGDIAASHILYLDETIFHVQGGGQPFDLGTISISTDSKATAANFNVTAVRQAEQGVQHIGTLQPDSIQTVAAGSNVSLAIDTDRRLLNSRLHTAGHILGVAIMDLSRSGQLPSLIETKANHHPGQAAVEFEGLIEGKYKELIQKRTDEVVKEARAVKICFWGREECQAKGIALPEKIADTDGQIYRAIEIEGYGAYACGGTHVHDTSGVGNIFVKKISRQKGTTRVSYDVR